MGEIILKTIPEEDILNSYRGKEWAAMWRFSNDSHVNAVRVAFAALTLQQLRPSSLHSSPTLPTCYHL